MRFSNWYRIPSTIHKCANILWKRHLNGFSQRSFRMRSESLNVKVYPLTAHLFLRLNVVRGNGVRTRCIINNRKTLCDKERSRNTLVHKISIIVHPAANIKHSLQFPIWANVFVLHKLSIFIQRPLRTLSVKYEPVVRTVGNVLKIWTRFPWYDRR